MKKLMTILVLFAMCGVAMAQDATVRGTDSAIKQIPLTNGEHDYINFVNRNTQGTSFLKYTVTDSQQLISGYKEVKVGYEQWTDILGYSHNNYTKPIYENQPQYSNDSHNIGHVYFTVTASQADIDAYNATHDPDMTKAIVQFAGTYMDSGSPSMVQDYGIYLYNPTTGVKGTFYSVTDGNTGIENVFEFDPGDTFGVYYKNDKGEIITTTDNWIGNYDTGQKDGKNPIKVYDDNHPNGYDTTTYKKFMCLLNTNDNSNGQEKIHWEFMLETMLDNPYYKVEPEDFLGNGETFTNEDGVTGQPLPGTLATLLIGGLCAGSLRKRNKK